MQNRAESTTEPGLPDNQIFPCYGVSPSNLHAWRTAEHIPEGPSAAVTLELPDGRQLERTVLLEEPVGGLQLILHLDEPNIPPPMATALMFAGHELPNCGSLAAEAVMEGSILQLQLR